MQNRPHIAKFPVGRPTSREEPGTNRTQDESAHADHCNLPLGCPFPVYDDLRKNLLEVWKTFTLLSSVDWSLTIQTNLWDESVSGDMVFPHTKTVKNTKKSQIKTLRYRDSFIV